MNKTNPEILIKEVADIFNTFLKAGINIGSFSQGIDPELNINNIERLLKIHFVLSNDVIEFVQTLSKRLRRIKTTVNRKFHNLEGEVKGRIHCQKTISFRFKSNPLDSTLFVCELIERNYNINENIVLKKLISIIYLVIYNELKPAIDNNYEWIGGWSEEKKLKQTIKNVFFKNIYMNRITEIDHKITYRIINSVIHSRSAFYRRAAELLLKYRKIMNYDINENEAKELLTNTFIKPKKTEVLFELYWVLKIIKELIKNIETVKFEIIEEGRNLVASWEDDKYKYKIYHDSTGNFEFFEKIPDDLPDKDGYFFRKVKALEKWQELSDKYFSLAKEGTLWNGRPDIILEKYEKGSKDNLKEVLIGEVKYTNDKGYAVQGLKELLEYIALIKRFDKYFAKKEEIFSSKEIKGCLFIDKVDVNDIKSIDNIIVIKFGDDLKSLNKN